MSLTDVGLQFKMTGADDFQSKISGLKSSYDAFSNATAKGIDVSPHIQKMSGHFDALHKNVSRGLKLTETAIAAFLAGSAVKGLANWITGGQRGQDIDKMKDFIRFKEGDDAYIKAVGDKMKGLSQQRPFDTLDAWEAQEQIISMSGPNRPDLAARNTESAANLGYVLGGPKGSSNRAMDYARTIIESYGTKMDADEKAAFLEKNAVLLDYITRTTQTKGKDIEGIARQIASPYAAAGKSIEEMYAVAGILGGAMGEPGGEVAKNIMSKQGTAYGGFMAEVDKQDYLARLKERFPWIQSEADLPEKLQQDINKAKSQAKKAYEAEGGRLAAKGDLPQLMANVLAGKKRLEELFPILGKDPVGVIAEHYGETAIKGFNTYAEAVASGRLNRMIQDQRKLDPSGLTGKINAEQKSLGGKAETLDQAISGLSTEFRRIFEPAAVGIIDEAKKAFVDMRSQLDTLNKEGGLSKNMKEAVAGVMGGYKNAVYGQEEAPKSFDDIFKEFAQSLGSGGWAESGQKLGAAIGEFAVAATRFGEIVSYLHSWLPKKDQNKPQTSAAEETMSSAAWAIGMKRILGWPGAIYGWLSGKDAMDTPWGATMTGAAAGYGLAGLAGLFPGAVAGATYPLLKAGAKPENADMWPLLRGSAAEILNAKTQAQPAGAAKPQVTNEVEATINEEKLTDWLTIKIKTIIKDLGGQKNDSWQNSQDWGAMPGTGGP